MPLFRKKPVVIEAVQWSGHEVNCEEVFAFLGYTDDVDTDAEEDFHELIYIQTMEGLMEASPGDWIIKGVQGEFYPCKPDIFQQTYEEVVTGGDS